VIPLVDLTAQYRRLQPELDAAMQAVAADGRYILGPNVSALEAAVAQLHRCAYGIGVANGTDALHLALRALRIGPGDEVITTPFTFIATTEAIGMVGARPVFVDVEPDTLNLAVDQVARKITARTRVLLPVHLYGHPCDMAPLMELARAHGLSVVEDCAQAIGATYRGQPVGSFGTVGCFSFFPTKNLSCMGDGGMCTTNDPQVAGRIEFLRRHGGRVKYRHSELGLNSRLDELQAAILRVKLPHLAEWTAARRRLCARYRNSLARIPGIDLLAERPDVEAVCHQFTVRVARRDQVQQRLKDNGIQTMVYYPVPLHLQEVHADLGHVKGDFPVAEAAAETCLSLPLYPELREKDQDQVIARLIEAVS
jgi:dTDP-4-amino-4,6-dideoxygalactose transaminase